MIVNDHLMVRLAHFNILQLASNCLNLSRQHNNKEQYKAYIRNKFSMSLIEEIMVSLMKLVLHFGKLISLRI